MQGTNALKVGKEDTKTFPPIRDKEPIFLSPFTKSPPSQVLSPPQHNKTHILPHMGWF